MLKKFFKVAALVILAVLIAAAGFFGYKYYKIKNTKDTRDLQARVDELSQKLIDEKQTVGLVVGVIQGDKWYVQGYGSVNKHSQVTPDSSSIFEIGSITKVFTASLAELLVEKRMMNWGDNIQLYLPSSVKIPNHDNTTLKHLASHTSGFPNVPDTFLKAIKEPCNPYKNITYEGVYSYLFQCTGKKKADFKNAEYSNFGFGLLGIIMELRTGKNFETLVSENICHPLGMNHTSIRIADADTSKFLTGFDEDGNPACHWDIPVLSGAGALRSNMADMMKFLRANLFNTTTLSDSFSKTQQKIASTFAAGFAYGWQVGYGRAMDYVSCLLFGINKIIWKNGGTGGFRTYIGFDNEHKIGVIVMANQETDAVDALAISILTKAELISLK